VADKIKKFKILMRFLDLTGFKKPVRSVDTILAIPQSSHPSGLSKYLRYRDKYINFKS